MIGILFSAKQRVHLSYFTVGAFKVIEGRCLLILELKKRYFKLLAKALQFGHPSEFVLGVVKTIFKILALLSFLAGNGVGAFLVLTLTVEVVFDLFGFGFGRAELIVDLVELVPGIIEGVLQFVDGLLIFLHFELVVFVLVYGLMQLYLLML